MRKCLIHITLFFLLTTANVARAMFPVFDASALGQAISTNIAHVDQAVKSVTQIKALESTIAILGDIKKGLAALASLKAKIDEAIRLVQQGMALVTESIKVAQEIVGLIEDAKELYTKPVQIAKDAVKYAEEAVAYLNSADEYAKNYMETLKEANEILRSGDVLRLKTAEELLRKAKELNNNSRKIFTDAQRMANKAEQEVRKVAKLYKDLIALNKNIARTQQRMCMLQVKARQLKAAFSRTYCYKPNGDKAEFAAAKALCVQLEQEENQETNDEVAKVCRTKTKEAMDRIKAFDDAVKSYSDKLGGKIVSGSSQTLSDLVAQELTEKAADDANALHDSFMEESNNDFANQLQLEVNN